MDDVTPLIVATMIAGGGIVIATLFAVDELVARIRHRQAARALAAIEREAGPEEAPTVVDAFLEPTPTTPVAIVPVASPEQRQRELEARADVIAERNELRERLAETETTLQRERHLKKRYWNALKRQRGSA